MVNLVRWLQFFVKTCWFFHGNGFIFPLLSTLPIANSSSSGPGFGFHVWRNGIAMMGIRWGVWCDGGQILEISRSKMLWWCFPPDSKMFPVTAGCFPSILRGSGCQGALFLDTNIFPGLFVLHLVTWCFGSGFLGSVPTTPAQVVMRIPTMDRNPETRAILSDPRAQMLAMGNLGDRVTEPPFPILRSIEQKKGSVVLYHTHFFKRIFPFFGGGDRKI